MFPSVEIKPLLDPNETEFSGDYGFIPPTLDLSNGDFSHSYTDLLSLTNTQETKHFNQPKNTRNALGTINGVYVPCLLNIIGVILFLRLGWGIGQAGVEGMLLIFFMAELQAVLTVLSASTIASNGAMQGGGSYFLISRSLGPEFGGAVGLQFYFLYMVGVSMYLVGFAEEAQQTWFQHTEIEKKWIVVIIATIALIVILIIAIIGADAFAKVNKYLFLLQFASVSIGAFFVLIISPHKLENEGMFTGPKWDILKQNLRSHFTSEQGVCGESQICDLAAVYAIVFPLATGFMEGLNLSGDLKNPGRSIPVGTLAAVATSCVIYISLIFLFAASFTGPTLRNNFTFFQEVSPYQFIIISGVLVSCFSSALGALFGASRILQALARDNLFPIFKMMAQGSTNGDEPQNAVIFTCILTQVFICIGDLDVIAPICTSFFCLAYAAVNFTCFLLQVTGVPNFRPTFKYHSWHLSLIGAVLNIGVMIYLNAIYAVISLLVLCCLFLYLYLTAPSTSWGDISQALIFHQVRKYLLRLDVRKAHSKFWRPSVLLLTTQVEKAQMDVILCNSLKKGGLYVIGNVVEGPFCQVTNLKRTEQSQAWMSYLSDSNLKAIPQIVVAKDEIEGYRALMQTAGIGGMQINTVVLPWIDSLLPTQESRYVGLILDALLLKKHAVVLRHTDKVDARFLTHQPTGLKEMNNSFARENTIDVWFMKEELVDSSFEKNPVSQFSTLSCTSTAALMLQLAYVLYSNKAWKKKCKIRLIKLSNSHDSKIMQQERMRLEQVAEELRIDVGDILIVPWNPLPNYFPETPTLTGPTIKEYFDQEIGVTEMNKTIQRYSMGTAQIILPLPHPTKYTNSHDTCKNYVSRLDLLTKNLPSTMLILSEDDTCVISTCI